MNLTARVWPGTAYPLGATYNGTGTNFSLFSEVATRVELCLFDESGSETRFDLNERDAFVVTAIYSTSARASDTATGFIGRMSRRTVTVAIPTNCCWIFDLIQQDPVVSQVKLIAEPWHIGENGYNVGGFPPLWSEWNGKYRDAVRNFWRGEDSTVGEFASRFTGSAVAVFLNGAAIGEPDDRGEHVVDDSFLILFNAYHEPIDFIVPDLGVGVSWRIELDTAAPRDPTDHAVTVRTKEWSRSRVDPSPRSRWRRRAESRRQFRPSPSGPVVPARSRCCWSRSSTPSHLSLVPARCRRSSCSRRPGRGRRRPQ